MPTEAPTSKGSRAAPLAFTVIVDNREKLPFAFEGMRPIDPRTRYTVVRGRLETGDYTLEVPLTAGPADRIVIERKSLADLYHSVTHERIRFENEFKRLAAFGYSAVVIEADYAAIMEPNKHLSRPTDTVPKSVVATLLAWSQRYDVHIWPCPGRQFAEGLTFRLLERWARDHR